MATVFGTGTIQHARPYWLERVPYTTVITSIAAGATEPLFAVRGWNNASNPAATMVRLEGIAVPPIPHLQVVVRSDQEQVQFDAVAMPDNLELFPVGATAFRSISASLVNRGSSTITTVPVRYQMAIWQTPIAAKLMFGQQVTNANLETLKSFKASPSQFARRGHIPQRLDAIIANSYENRILAAVEPYALATTLSASAPVTIPPVLAQPEQALILRRIGVAARFEDRVTVSVDRDTDTAEVDVQPLPGDLDHPVEVFLPATQQLAFSVSCTHTPDGAVPIRLEVWRVALSDLLDVRMGLTTEAELAATDGPATAEQVFSRVSAGVL